MKLIHANVALALLLSGASAVPFPSAEEVLTDENNRVSAILLPEEAVKSARYNHPRNPRNIGLTQPSSPKRWKRGGKEVQVNGGEYWLAMGSAGKKRAVLEPNCTQTGKTVTCSYTIAELEAARALGTELHDSCYHTTEGITCIYDVSAEEPKSPVLRPTRKVNSPF
ncbi:hypothetical protein BKA61DRAFT_573020 [Leptodontidium sp. MPI-SDFR-AT-0119]|nr:hypothetical protein BKA61DRAFT_573020 [Leptodontidium sp. MPI-SDFR-AT-0119]